MAVIGLVGLITSCSGDSDSSGSNVLNDRETILVGCDTFGLSSGLREGAPIYTTPDSFLLGESETPFGTVHADILTQFVCPEGFRYPDGAEVDSVCLFIYYTSWYGDGLTPLSFNVYEMDGKVMQYTGIYSDLEPVSDYCSKSICVVDKPRIIVAKHPTDSVQNNSTGTYMPYIRFKLTDSFRDKLFAIKDFSSQETFNELFKGLYITSEFGGATILHVPEISMAMYYHFPYQLPGDTAVRKEVDVKGFYANTEVRQINHYELNNSQLEYLTFLKDELDFVLSPGYIFTRLKLPVGNLCDSILSAIGDRRTYVNRAEVAVEILNGPNYASWTGYGWAMPSDYMMLIKEDALDWFFESNELPSDSCALLESITLETDSAGENRYYYNYDLSTLLTQQLREREAGRPVPDTLAMVLVPVDVKTSTTSSSSTTVTAVQHKQTISVTVIKSANISTDPMQLEVVYSGF